jgi:hypothetical protein
LRSLALFLSLEQSSNDRMISFCSFFSRVILHRSSSSRFIIDPHFLSSFSPLFFPLSCIFLFTCCINDPNLLLLTPQSSIIQLSFGFALILFFLSSLSMITKGDQNARNILVLMFGFQVVIQISIFLTLFLMMCDTYLFRVGLLGILAKQFKFVLFVHPLYIICGAALGGYRVTDMTNGVSGECDRIGRKEGRKGILQREIGRKEGRKGIL